MNGPEGTPRQRPEAFAVRLLELNGETMLIRTVTRCRWLTSARVDFVGRG